MSDEPFRGLALRAVLVQFAAVFVRFFAITLLLFACAIARAAEAEGRVLKVLVHHLDIEGRQSLSPSLYERDAYQAFLRKHPEKVSGVRFDVQWKAKHADAARLKLRLEAIGARASLKEPFVLDVPVKPDRWGGTWSALTMDKEVFARFGEPAAWRITLWEGDRMIAEQKSFVW